MNLKLEQSKLKSDQSLVITGSKSESNRLLLLQALFPEISLENLSNSDDTRLMKAALASSEEIVDIHHAGTAMRFLTAYFSVQEGRKTILTGSRRMKERPIRILVDALKSLGAEITYLENEGFPPLRIQGKKLEKSKVSIKADVSSQYISALLLIASSLKHGLEIELIGKITSWPYINMTLELLERIGVETVVKGQSIRVNPRTTSNKRLDLTVESDWSSASYFYSLIALSPIGSSVRLRSYKTNSLQGDSELVDIYKSFGVSTIQENDSILISKNSESMKQVNFDLANTPDLAQTIAVTCLGLGCKCDLTGLHTLKIKETDRLVALKTEIEKFGAEVYITGNSLTLKSPRISISDVEVETYNDHRMAMAFAPLALRTELQIKDAGVVSKSYPDFWEHMSHIGLYAEPSK